MLDGLLYFAWVVACLLGMVAMFGIPFAIGLYMMWKIAFEPWAKDIDRRQRELNERRRQREKRDAEMRKPC